MSSGGAAGVVLEGKYRLLEEVGTGAMGTVFRALDESLDRVVAVKFLLPEYEARRDLVERFQREARAMASVTHENVASINALGVHGSSHFFVMEYIEGEAGDVLLEAARKTGRLPPLHIVLRVMEQTCAGLQAVHDAGVVHRDIKPGNIIIETGTGRAVITDFGLGRRYRKGERMGRRGVGGTPGYLAPEIIAERAIPPEEDHLTDIYAFGATAFELLTGELPFNEDSVVLMLQAHLTTEPRPPSVVRPDVPKAVDDVVVRCLAKKPSERFPTCAAIGEALAAVSLPPPRMRPPSASPPPEPVARRVPTAQDLAVAVRIIVSHPDVDRRKALAKAAREAIPSCKVWSAAGAADALRMARAHSALVLVVSMDDPEMSALELASEVRDDPSLRTLRLVVDGTEPTDEDRKIFQGLGVFDFIDAYGPQDTVVSTLRRSLKPKGGPASPRPR